MLAARGTKWDVEANWAAFEEQFLAHRDDGVDVFLTPECFLDGYAATEDGWTVERFAGVAQRPGESEYLERACDLAERAATGVVFGFTELRDGRFYNAALVVDAGGERLGTYRKTHLQTHDRRFAPGDDLPVFDFEWGRAGTAICADRRWPETIRTLRLRGAEVCLVPTDGMAHRANEWWMRTRAYENQCYVCFAHPAVALITNPAGEVDAILRSSRPDVLVHDLDLGAVADDNHLADRRPELYGVLADETHPSRQAPYDPPRVDRR